MLNVIHDYPNNLHFGFRLDLLDLGWTSIGVTSVGVPLDYVTLLCLCWIIVTFC